MIPSDSVGSGFDAFDPNSTPPKPPAGHDWYFDGTQWQLVSVPADTSTHVSVSTNPEGVVSSYLKEADGTHLIARDRNGNILSDTLVPGTETTGGLNQTPTNPLIVKTNGVPTGYTYEPTGQVVNWDGSPYQGAGYKNGYADTSSSSGSKARVENVGGVLYEEQPDGSWKPVINPSGSSGGSSGGSTSFNVSGLVGGGGGSSGGGTPANTTHTSTSITDITPAAAAAELALANAKANSTSTNYSTSDIGPNTIANNALDRAQAQAQFDAKQRADAISNIINNLSNPADMVAREYSTRALGVPAGSTLSLGSLPPISSVMGGQSQPVGASSLPTGTGASSSPTSPTGVSNPTPTPIPTPATAPVTPPAVPPVLQPGDPGYEPPVPGGGSSWADFFSTRPRRPADSPELKAYYNMVTRGVMPTGQTPADLLVAAANAYTKQEARRQALSDSVQNNPLYMNNILNTHQLNAAGFGYLGGNKVSFAPDWAAGPNQGLVQTTSGNFINPYNVHQGTPTSKGWTAATNIYNDVPSTPAQPTNATPTPFGTPTDQINNGQPVLSHASGGPISGMGIVGDSPSGKPTGHEELVVGNAQVIPHDQTEHMLRTHVISHLLHFATGGTVGGAFTYDEYGNGYDRYGGMVSSGGYGSNTPITSTPQTSYTSTPAQAPAAPVTTPTQAATQNTHTTTPPTTTGVAPAPNGGAQPLGTTVPTTTTTSTTATTPPTTTSGGVSTGGVGVAGPVNAPVTTTPTPVATPTPTTPAITTPSVPTTANPANDLTAALASGSPAAGITSYPDSAYQNFPSLSYLQGNTPVSDYMKLNTGNAQGAFGTQIPYAGAINYTKALDIMKDPSSFAALSSLYKAANLDLSSEIAKALARAPIGQAVATSGVQT